jgi:hypothetical protein
MDWPCSRRPLRFRVPNSPKPLAEVPDRFHLTPSIRAKTSSRDVFVLALAEEAGGMIRAR